MSQEDKDKLKLALAIMSGRLTVEDLSYEGFAMLGYDHYRFAYYGKPTEYDIKCDCENIVLNLINKAIPD